jgi:hypothetical protein
MTAGDDRCAADSDSTCGEIRGKVVGMGRTLRWAITIILGLLVIPIIVGVVGEFFIELARERGWYAHPVRRWDLAMSAVSAFVAQTWFLILTALVAGLTLGLWANSMLRKWEHRYTDDRQLPSAFALKAAKPDRLDAFVYLAPPDRDRLIIQWKSPIRDRNAAVALDFRPEGEPSRRLSLADTASLVEGQTMKTEVARRDDNGTWVWSTPDGGIIHCGTVMCRLAVIASDGTPFYWRFAIAAHKYKETPRVVGENSFEHDFH